MQTNFKTFKKDKNKNVQKSVLKVGNIIELKDKSNEKEKRERMKKHKIKQSSLRTDDAKILLNEKLEGSCGLCNGLIKERMNLLVCDIFNSKKV